MAILLCLPDELLLEILSYLIPVDLNIASRVCRRINNITTPLLYNDPWLIAYDEDPTDLSAFIRTLLTPGCKSLATHVRNLHLDWSGEPTPLSQSDQVLFKSAAIHFGLGDRPMTESVQVILLLHLLPQLHTLGLLPPHHCDEFKDFIDSLTPLQPIETLPIAFQSLRAYDCQFGISSNYVCTTMLLTLLRLPYIQSIMLSASNRFHVIDGGALIAAETASTVTHLELTSVRITSTALSTILKIPLALTHFSLYHYRVSMNYNFHALRGALDPLRTSLTSLVLDCYTSKTLATHRSRRSKTIGSLRDWPVLRSVKCTLLPILGVGLPGEPREIAPLLPACIRELEILDDNFWTAEDALCEAVVMVRQKQVMLQGLRRLAVYLARGGNREVRERLKSACVQAGVENMENIDGRLFADE